MPGSGGQHFAILDHSPIGHFVLDARFTIRFWNRCLEAWTGQSRLDMLGSNILDAFPHLGAAKYRSRIEPLFHGGPPITFSAQLHKHFLPAPLPGGKQRIQHTVVTAVAGDRPGERLALFSIQDVTSLTDAVGQYTTALQQLTREVEERQAEVLRRKEAEESLRELNRMKNDFIASAAHEISTPLSTILGYAELLQGADVAFSAEQQAGFVGDIIENTENLVRIVDDLLDLARFEQGRGVRLDKVPGAPEALMAKVVRRLQDHKVTHRFQLELATAGVQIAFDPLRLRQVLENLLSNAVKYSPPGSTITLRSAWNAERVLITVADQGSGMNEEQLAKMFDKFYRGDKVNSGVRGLGLGMSIVKQIVEQHGGTIHVSSTPGQGTTVTVALPR